MAHIQCEALQMLMSFVTPFKETSLQLDADPLATLLLFYLYDSTFSHLNMLVADSYGPVELKNHVCMILK